MAIDNMENRCLNRKEKSALKYPLQALNLDDPKNFNLFKQRSNNNLFCNNDIYLGIYAKAQLQFIEQYLKDFKSLLSNVNKNRPDLQQELKKKKDNNEII